MRYEAIVFAVENPNELGFPHQKSIALYHQPSHQLFLIDSLKQVGDTLYFTHVLIPDYLPVTNTKSFHTKFKYKDAQGKNVPTYKLPKPKDMVIYTLKGDVNWPSLGKAPLTALTQQSRYRPKVAKTVFLNTVAIAGTTLGAVVVYAIISGAQNPSSGDFLFF